MMESMGLSPRPRSIAVTGLSPREMVFSDGGFVPNDFICVRCESMLVNPVLTGCCGRNQCQKCVIDEKGGVCSLCGEGGFSFVRDNRVVREMKQAVIYCKHRSEGCSWVGSVEETRIHLTDDIGGCRFVDMHCSTCESVVKRHEFQDHLKANCYIQWVQCELCGKLLPEGSEKAHADEECPEYMSHCVHGCGTEVKRIHIKDHDEHCPNFPVECKFKSAGCNASLLRKNLTNHLEEKQVDHSLMSFMSLQEQVKEINKELSQSRRDVVEMKGELEMANLEITQLKSKLSNLLDSHAKIAGLLQTELQFFVNQPHTSPLKNMSIDCMRLQLALVSNPKSVVLRPGHPLIFRLPMYSYYKTHDIPWISPPFFIHNDYQMSIAVHLNGDQEGRGTHISIHVHLVAGANDGKLVWPLIFNDIITVSLFKQVTETPKTGRMGSHSPMAKCRSKPYNESHYAQQQTIRTVVYSLNRVNKPVGEIGLSFGYISLFFAQSNVDSLVLVNDSLVFHLGLRNQNTLNRV